MKKFLGIVVLGLLLVTSKAFSKEELYWCQYEHANLFVEEGEPWGIPVSIIPEENKINFLKEFNSSDGVKWPSMVYKKRFFKINEKNENSYKASGPWDDVDKRIVDVIFERENNRLLYKFEGLDYISIFFCTNN
jgi:hypothetical protein|tara:strand:+ start:69 stop:470 length:402 start_codon:yes stop_codon:yes gene_type:complete